MIVKTLVRFTDLKENEIREVDDEFEVSKSRFDEIKKAGDLIEALVEVKDDKNKSTDKDEETEKVVEDDKEQVVEVVEDDKEKDVVEVVEEKTDTKEDKKKGGDKK